MSDDEMSGSVTPLRRPGGNAWMGELSRGKTGPYAIISNAVIVLSRDAELVGLVATDDFAHCTVVTRPPPPPYLGAPKSPGPYPRPINDSDVTLVQSYIQRCYEMRITQAVAQQAVLHAAETHHTHPIRDWLDKLKWDGVPRLATWLHVAFGAPKDAFHAAIGTKFLVAAVRRVRRPGTKFDSVLVLEGRQGRGKSRACAALFGQEWFTDNLPHDLASKDAQQAMAGRWGIELAELEALTKSSSGAAKAFFSRQVDYFRPSYGKVFVERPRQCVLIGTTNEADYLTDSTGNRRYWPVQCEKAEVAWISEMREQLWAEAAVVEADDEPLWLEQDKVSRKAEVQQVTRQTEDTWTNPVREWIKSKSPAPTSIKVSDVLHNGLGLPRAQQNRGTDMRVASILRADGWVRHKHRSEGIMTVSWFAPGAELPGRGGARVPVPEPFGDADSDDTTLV